MWNDCAQFPVPPTPAWAAAEQPRLEETRLRRRLLTGTWSSDLWDRMHVALGTVRREAIGAPDLSANPFEAVCSGAAALFDALPRETQPDEASRAALARLVRDAQLYPLLGRLQADTLGMREGLLKVGARVEYGAPRLIFESVPPDLCLFRADPDAPSRPIQVWHAVERAVPGRAERVWTWEHWSVEGEPSWRVLASDGSTDISEWCGLPAGGLRGAAYPYREASGRPRLPFALAHAAVTGRLLDPFFRSEIVQGTLNVGVLWTFFGHCVRNAAWAQRWIAGGKVKGAKTEEGTSHRRIVADPASILEILQDSSFEGQVQAGQWGSVTDPLAVANALGVYEARFAGYAGLPAGEILKGDPRSGYALAVSEAGKRASQRRYAPVFEPFVIEALELSAIAVNAALGGRFLAERGWGIEWVSLPPSAEERRALRDEVLALLQQGLISRVEARARLLDEDLDTARQQLATMETHDARPDPAGPRDPGLGAPRDPAGPAAGDPAGDPGAADAGGRAGAARG